MGLAEEDFENALLKPQIKAGEFAVTSTVDPERAAASSHALSKAIYERIFKWLVDRINGALENKGRPDNFIGVLDIAGFEIFETNSFEQICINYTNEKLQQFFNHRMFILEQQTYHKEGINWNFIDFGRDLQPTIDLIEQPLGIMSILDEECLFPKATDESYIRKLVSRHSKDDKFETLRLEPKSFICKHYAGDVKYDVSGWLNKNKDPLNENVSRLFAQSSNEVLSSLFKDYETDKDDMLSRRKKGSQFITVSKRHRVQLGDLMKQIQSTTPHFVRCIIPNENKQSGVLASELVLHQLRCNGVLEGIRITRLGFPSRIAFGEFRFRYEVLAPPNLISKELMDDKVAAIKLLESFDIAPDEYQIGKSKVFLKTGSLGKLEEARNIKLSRVMAGVQAHIRGFLVRSAYANLKKREEKVVILQRNVRAFFALKKDRWYQLFVKVRPLLGAFAQEKVEQKMRSKIKALEEELEAARQEKDQVERTMDDVKRSLSEENTELSVALEETIATLTRLEEQRLAHEAENSELHQRLKQQSAAQEDLVDQLEVLTAEKRGLISKFEEQGASLEAVLKDLDSAQTELETHRTEKERALEDITSFSTQIQELQGEHERSKAMNENLNRTIEELKRRNTSTKTQLDESRKAMESKEQDMAKLSSELAETSDELAKKAAQLTQLQAKFADLTTKYESGLRENQTVQERLKKRDQDFIDMRQKHQAALLENERLVGEIQLLQEELEDDSNQLLEIQRVTETKDRETAAMKDVHRREMQELQDRLSASRKNLQKELDEKHQDLLSAKSELKDMSAQFDAEKQRVKSLSDQIERMNMMNQSFERKVGALKEERKNYESTLSSIKENHDIELRNLTQRYDRDVGTLRAEIERLKEETETSSRKVSVENDHKVAQLKSELAGLTKERALLKQDVLMITNELEQNMEKVDAQEKQILDLEKQLSQQTMEARRSSGFMLEVDSLKAELATTSHKFQEAQHMLSVKTAEAEESLRELEDLRTQHEELTQRLSKSEVYLTKSTKAKEVTDSKFKSLASELEAEKTRFKALSEDYDRLASSLSESTNRISAISEENDSLRSRIRSLESELISSSRRAPEEEGRSDEMEQIVRSLDVCERTIRNLQVEIDQQATYMEEVQMTNAELEQTISSMRVSHQEALMSRDTQMERVKTGLEGTISDLRSKLEESASKIRQMEVEKDLIEKQSSQIMQRSLSLPGMQDLDTLRKQSDEALRKLQAELDRSQFDKQKLEEKFALELKKAASLTEKLQQAKDDLMDARTETKRLTSQLRLMESRQSTSDREMDRLQTRCQSLESDLDHNSTLLTERTKSLEDAESELRSVRLDLETQKRKHDALMASKSLEFKESKRQLTVEMDRLSSQLNQTALKLALEENVSQKRMRELETVKRSLESESAVLSETATERRTLQSEVTSLKSKLQSRTEELTEWKHRNERLEKELAESRAQSEAIGRKLETMHLTHATARDCAQDLEVQLRMTEDALSTVQSHHAQLKSHLGVTEQRLSEAKSHILGLESEKRTLFMQLQDVKGQLAEMDRRLEDEVRDRTQDMEDQLVSTQQTLEEMKQQNQHLLDALKQSRDDHAELESRLESTHRSQKSSAGQVQQYESQLDQLREQVEAYEKREADLCVHLNVAETQLHELKQASKELVQRDQAREVRVKQLEHELDETRSQLDHAQQDAAQMRTRIASLESELSQTETSLRSRTDELAQSNAHLATLNHQLEHTQHSLTAESQLSESLQTSKLSLETTVGELQSQLQHLQSELESKFSVANKRLESRARALSDTSQSLLSTNTQLQKENRELDQQLKQQEVQFKKELRDLEEKVVGVHQKKAEVLLSKTRALKREVQELKDENAGLKRRIHAQDTLSKTK